MMLKEISKTLILLTLVFDPQAMAEEKLESAWKNSVVGGLNMTQTGFDNWAAGGENAFSWQINVNYKFEQSSEKTTWTHSGKMVFGATKAGDEDMQKSIDEIKAESVLIYNMGSSINPFIAVTGETQFAAGYNYGENPAPQISAFMDPGYFRESLGAGMDIRKGLSTRLGLSLKQTITKNYPIPYADDVNTVEVETLRSEFGAESVSDLLVNLSETSTFVSKLELFSAFIQFSENIFL